MLRRCICGGQLSPKVYRSRAQDEVRLVCENQWSEAEHRPVRCEGCSYGPGLRPPCVASCALLEQATR